MSDLWYKTEPNLELGGGLFDPAPLDFVPEIAKEMTHQPVENPLPKVDPTPPPVNMTDNSVYGEDLTVDQMRDLPDFQDEVRRYMVSRFGDYYATTPWDKVGEDWSDHMRYVEVNEVSTIGEQRWLRNAAKAEKDLAASVYDLWERKANIFTGGDFWDGITDYFEAAVTSPSSYIGAGVGKIAARLGVKAATSLGGRLAAGTIAEGAAALGQDAILQEGVWKPSGFKEEYDPIQGGMSAVFGGAGGALDQFLDTRAVSKGLSRQLIGGVNADLSTSEVNAYFKAQTLLGNGERPEKVWQDTGWFADDDGVLRFEIPDDQFEITNIDPNDKVKADQFFDGMKGELFRAEISHPILKKYYPRLLDNIPIYVGQSGTKQGLMSVNVQTGEVLRLAATGGSEIEISSVLLHEIQHVIQEFEDFPRGGNPEMFKAFAGDNDFVKAVLYQTLLGEKEAQYVANRFVGDTSPSYTRSLQPPTHTRDILDYKNVGAKKGVYPATSVIAQMVTPKSLDLRALMGSIHHAFMEPDTIPRPLKEVILQNTKKNLSNNTLVQKYIAEWEKLSKVGPADYADATITLTVPPKGSGKSIFNLYSVPETSSEMASAFRVMGDFQRGDPERHMVETQSKMGGGVMSYAIEHIGDLTHRMSEVVRLPESALDTVTDKVDKMLRLLTSGYGFKREFFENLNTNYKGSDFDSFKNEVIDDLKKYANLHREVPVYNDMQFAAREAAVALGELRVKDAVNFLEIIKEAAEDGTLLERMREFRPDKFIAP